MPYLFEAPLTKDQLLMRGFIERAIIEFRSNMSASRIMRRLAADHPDLFFVAAVHLLKNQPDSPGIHYLGTLLLSQIESVKRLADPRYFTRSESAALFKRLMDIDRMLDLRLARELPGRYGELRALDLTASAQMLDLLDQISPGRRLIPIMGYLTQHPDRLIAAKATLLVARRIQSSDWIRRQIAAPDPRIRANVVEGLWGVQQPYARSTYEECLADVNNRVVGNALLGLHLLGEAGATPRILGMARDGRPPFRWTAAWVMGQTANPAHVSDLQALMRDDTPGVRSAALRSLFSIRRVTAPKTEKPRVPVEPTVEVEEEEEEFVPIPVELRLDGSAFRFQGDS